MTTKRHKPLYKKVLTYKENIFISKKFQKFQKKKWFLYRLKVKRLERRLKNNYKLFNQNLLYIPRFLSRRKFLFKNNLLTRQKLSLFYGELSYAYLRKLKTLSLKQYKTNTSSFYYMFFFLKNLESRLDVILFRSHFTTSLKQSRQLIYQGHVKVNGKPNLTRSCRIRKGDIIEFSEKIVPLIHFNVLNSNLWPIPPKNLQINYKTSTIIFANDLNLSDLSAQSPFFFNLNSIFTKLFS